MSAYKVDFHTHSMYSPDGSLTLAHYHRMLESGGLDYVAITDHNTIEFALQAQIELDGRIIVGEEITTAEGEIIGLYLEEAVPAGLPLAETVGLITAQGGLVYVPHPFETMRKGVTRASLDAVAPAVAIVETHNGRAIFERHDKKAVSWAAEHSLPGAAGSDAHGWHGWGKTYTVVDEVPTRANLQALLAHATCHIGSPGLRGVLYPKFNRFRKIF